VKDNHIPRRLRLENRIHKLQEKINWGNYWTHKRYYPQCKYCDMTNVSVNMNKGFHRNYCFAGNIEKEISYYQTLLDEENLTRDETLVE
jgi:hypothetical protein